MFRDMMKPNKAATNMLSFSYALYDTNGSQVPQEFVEKIGKVFEAILEEVIASLSSWCLFIYADISWVLIPCNIDMCTDWQIKGRNEGRYFYS